MTELLTIKEASKWASRHLNKHVTTSNISYLIQYGKVKKHSHNGNTSININELLAYYKEQHDQMTDWKKKLGQDLNWSLSFSEYKEAETTKHVHRLHPYKGKFIPQLVEYFLDDHTDEFKTQTFFKRGDTVLDPFCGSGTTLVQANELGMNAIGIDVSEFNSFISNAKLGEYDLQQITTEADKITKQLIDFQKDKHNVKFEHMLLDELRVYNDIYFPTPDFKYRVKNNLVDEITYGREKEQEFLASYKQLIKKYNIPLKQPYSDSFLDKWFLQVVRDEIDFVFGKIKKISNEQTRKIASLILSRTIRSCRATTHADLATLIEPISHTYYCKKHGKICKPLFSILGWWKRYTKDTIKRLALFDRLRTDTNQICITGDSRNINIGDVLNEHSHPLAPLIKDGKIAGIFSSPPYVGLIDYHEQHAYAYDLFDFERKDELEIGPLYRGQGMDAKRSYIEGVSHVLNNSKQYLKNDYNVFLVANDKYGLYPSIAKEAGMKIVNQYKRPVLNRTEKDKAAYAEIIFHLKEG